MGEFLAVIYIVSINIILGIYIFFYEQLKWSVNYWSHITQVVYNTSYYFSSLIYVSSNQTKANVVNHFMSIKRKKRKLTVSMDRHGNVLTGW